MEIPHSTFSFLIRPRGAGIGPDIPQDIVLEGSTALFYFCWRSVRAAAVYFHVPQAAQRRARFHTPGGRYFERTNSMQLRGADKRMVRSWAFAFDCSSRYLLV
jgi:hypothetical protein